MKSMPAGAGQFERISSLAGACALFVGIWLAGCGPSNQPTAEERQEKALKDPFSYSPDSKNSDMTVSGHDDFDKKDLKRDLDHVINP
jgi:hypothetical protein